MEREMQPNPTSIQAAGRPQQYSHQRPLLAEQVDFPVSQSSPPTAIHPLQLLRQQQRETAPILPIDDFHLLEQPNKYSDDERQLRIKLAAAYRLIELNGWAMSIYNHVTAKLDKQHDRILIHPFGLHYNEITASSLLKIDMSGNIVDHGSTNFELNKPGYIVHSAIHMARPDLKAIIHLHGPPVAAASALRQGLLPVCQEQALLGEIAYLEYSGILTQEEEREAVAKGLGEKSKVMIMRNHGLMVCGETIEEAFHLLCNLMRACETQARLLSFGLDNLVLMPEDAAQQAYDMVQNARYPIRQLPSAYQSAHLKSVSQPSSPTGSRSISTTSAPCLSECYNANNSENDDCAESTSGNTSGNDSDFADSVISLSTSSSPTLELENGTDTTNSLQPMSQQKPLSTTRSSRCPSAKESRRPSTFTSSKRNIVGYVNMFELDFEAHMRALDLAGHQTGYRFKRPLVRFYKN